MSHSEVLNAWKAVVGSALPRRGCLGPASLCTAPAACQTCLWAALSLTWHWALQVLLRWFSPVAIMRWTFSQMRLIRETNQQEFLLATAAFHGQHTLGFLGISYFILLHIQSASISQLLECICIDFPRLLTCSGNFLSTTTTIAGDNWV